MSDSSTPISRLGHESLVEEVQKVITDTTGKEVPSPSSPLETLGFDSMTMLEVLARLEDRFDVALNENIIQEFRTIERIALIIKEAANT